MGVCSRKNACCSEKDLWKIMFVKHLQEYLDKFTDGKKGNAVSNATIYMQVDGHLEEIRRIEVQESNIIGQQSVRVVLKPADNKIIIAPTNPE